MTLTEIHSGESATLEFKELLSEQSLKYTKTAVAFAYMNLVEGWGSGIPRIIRECREYGLQEPEFIDADGFLRINMYRKNPISTVIQPVNEPNPPVNPESLPINLKLVLDLISANHQITYEQLAERMGKSRDTIRVYIKRLRTEYHLLDRVGAAKNGRWVILQPEDNKHD